MDDSQTLLAAIDGFLGRSGMAATTFGVKAVNNSKLVARLRAGSSVRLNTAEQIRAFIEAHERARPAS